LHYTPYGKDDSIALVTLSVWKLTLEYDGSRYRGWQSQKNARSIQDTVAKAAHDVLKVPVQLHGAGRTDAGVHALAQVAHLKARLRHPIESTILVDRLNQLLPADLVILSAEPVNSRFHARHHAVSRTYQYRISLRKQAFEKRYVWWVKDRLNLDRMAEAANLVVGRHDFQAFCNEDRSRSGESTIVVVESCTVQLEGSIILIRVTASHFLWRMVRRIAGVLVKVGKSELTVDQFESLFNPDSKLSGKVAEWTAPAAGLFLESVRY
jgi:tRNA pseudouridine38-40 synthase